MTSVTFNRHMKLIFCTCIISYIQFINGFSFVYSSTLLAELKKSTSSIKINSEDASWIASSPFIVCPICLIIHGILADKIGRRKSIQVAYIPAIVGYFLLEDTESTTTIIIGRVIIGTTLGGVTILYLYLAEVCPTEYRPLYFSVVNLFMGVGTAVESWMALHLHWYTVSSALYSTSVIGCAVLFSLPETPMWLKSQGRVRDAKEVEKWFGMVPAEAVTTIGNVEDQNSGTTGITRPVDQIEESRGGSPEIIEISESRGGSPETVDNGESRDGIPETVENATFWSIYARSNVWKPTLLTASFFACQQGTGFYVFSVYPSDVFRDFHVIWDDITVTVILMGSRIVGCLVFSLLCKVRRKTLVVCSSVGMALSVVVVIGFFKVYTAVDDPPLDFVTIVMFVSYVFFALLAIQPLPWTLCGEVFPMAVRGVMCGVVNVFGYELMFMIFEIYPTMVLTFGIEKVWFVFACFCILCTFYGAFMMPETKGKSLDDILESFESDTRSPDNNLE